MGINATVRNPSSFRINVDKEDGRLTGSEPVSLRNAITTTALTLEQLTNVNVINKTSGSILCYNISSNKWDVVSGLDGGLF